jgi:predicted Rossmann-fold nucleotide-binding protein
MVQKGFLKQDNMNMVIVSDDIDDLLQKMKNYQPPLA